MANSLAGCALSNISKAIEGAHSLSAEIPEADAGPRRNKTCTEVHCICSVSQY
jgi:hypothetical protein